MPRSVLSGSKLLDLSQCKVWDIIKEKANLRIGTREEISNQRNQNHRIFKAILQEVNDVLIAFEELLQNCLVLAYSEENEAFSLGTKISSLFKRDSEALWKLTDTDEISARLKSGLGDDLLPDVDGFDQGHDNNTENELLLQISYLPVKFDTELGDEDLDHILDENEDLRLDSLSEDVDLDLGVGSNKNTKRPVHENNPEHEESGEVVNDADVYPHECRRCTRRYKTTKNLTRHEKSCNGIPPPAVKPSWSKNPIDGRYHCSFPGCSTKKTWTCSSGVWKHFNSEHADLKDESYCVYSCELCDRRFPTKTMYNQHRKHKHVNFFEFKCNVCGKLLPSNERLRLHIRQHTGEKPYGCDLCDYRSITQSAVNQHKLRMHESALQRHVCDICGKTFKVKSNLKEHIKSHSDNRSFLCGFCGKALKNRQCLNRHLFTHGVKFTCSCGKNFANQTSLNVHKRDKHGDSI